MVQHLIPWLLHSALMRITEMTTDFFSKHISTNDEGSINKSPDKSNEIIAISTAIRERNGHTDRVNKAALHSIISTIQPLYTNPKTAQHLYKPLHPTTLPLINLINKNQ